ncbi:hypothetical protein JXB12_00030 [candidate division KSB1 bacterium]|nr:hypothetical protein [candidate division KSB1 bacterium]
MTDKKENRFITLYENTNQELPHEFIYKIIEDGKEIFRIDSDFKNLISEFYYNDIEFVDKEGLEYFILKYNYMSKKDYYQFVSNKHNSIFVKFAIIITTLTFLFIIAIELYKLSNTKKVTLVEPLKNINYEETTSLSSDSLDARKNGLRSIQPSTTNQDSSMSIK